MKPILILLFLVSCSRGENKTDFEIIENLVERNEILVSENARLDWKIRELNHAIKELEALCE